MPEIDPITGLPKDLGIFENLAKEDQKITVSVVKKKFGKQYTIIEGINEHEIDVKDVRKKLKARFACGGTSKGGTVELQGNHQKDIKRELVTLGFSPDTIEIIPFTDTFKRRR
jgi:translation initiation factor 1